MNDNYHYDIFRHTAEKVAQSLMRGKKISQNTQPRVSRKTETQLIEVIKLMLQEKKHVCENCKHKHEKH